MTEVIVLVLALFMVLSPLIFHEMGHSVMLKLYGVPVKQYWLGLGPTLCRVGKFHIGMLPVGGAVVPEPGAYAALRPLQRMATALAGPVFSLAYGLALLFAYHWHQDAGLIPKELVKAWRGLWLMAMLNFYLAAANLLPFPPLDGYHAMTAWLEHRGKPLSAKMHRLAMRVGNGFVFGVGFMVLGSVFIG